MRTQSSRLSCLDRALCALPGAAAFAGMDEAKTLGRQRVPALDLSKDDS